MSRHARAGGGRSRPLIGLLLLALIAGGGYWLWRTDNPILSVTERCTAEVDGREVGLTIGQAETAGLIAGIGVRRGLPARAVTIALATAYQESKISNINYGDRDSVGIFQQRPSQGWGSKDQLMDPTYSTNAFYDALEKVEGYQDLPVTVAAQKVQRSAYPEAYADHEEDARVLASALTGNSPAALSCRLNSPDDGATRLDEAGLTARAAKVRRELTEVFGEQSLGGFAPGGVRSGHKEGSAHYDGRALDIFFRPVDAERRIRGWAMAQYLITQADRLAIAHVIYDGRIWTAGSRSRSGWRTYDPGEGPGDQAVRMHRDHVHVDVA